MNLHGVRRRVERDVRTWREVAFRLCRRVRVGTVERGCFAAFGYGLGTDAVDHPNSRREQSGQKNASSGSSSSTSARSARQCSGGSPAAGPDPWRVDGTWGSSQTAVPGQSSWPPSRLIARALRPSVHLLPTRFTHERRVKPSATSCQLRRVRQPRKLTRALASTSCWRRAAFRTHWAALGANNFWAALGRAHSSRLGRVPAKWPPYRRRCGASM